MLYLAFREADFDGIITNLRQANYNWVLFSLLVTMMVHWVRALRWRMLIEPLDAPVPTLWFTYHVLMAGYLVNTALPRVGELSRCYMIQRKHGQPFSSILGTVVVERVADLIMLAVLLFVSLILQFELLHHFFLDQILSPLLSKVAVLFKSVPVYGWLLIVALLTIFSMYRFIRRQKHSNRGETSRFEKIILQLEQGLLSITRLKYPFLFIALTICIWLGYFFMTYLCFFATPPTSTLSAGAVLAIVGIGSIGRSVPVQAGGMGAYHWIVSQGLLLYGVGINDGLVMATIIHAAQTLFYLIMGGGSLIFLSVSFKSPSSLQ